jgi:hypothetical protein
VGDTLAHDGTAAGHGKILWALGRKKEISKQTENNQRRKARHPHMYTRNQTDAKEYTCQQTGRAQN